MSFGKMNSFIDIISPSIVTDTEGFSVKRDTILASVRAYREDRHGNRMGQYGFVFRSNSIV